ncbi:uncharacterized protein LOC117893382 isoform X2 [Drosophila subobscura]|uniref:uncharacterized protein LOC117893382 isoform X2 n=1 Tax=Drosophila subobscura TaxID=7241 RepID=UPI00155A0F8B|nr:uncharacterized protein LOC117893382 isoform X2 [Drosophila subobscura]
MEAINFNDFTPMERYEIIKAFLIKMRQANSMPSAQRFFEHYLRKFYKLPDKVVNDIAYCQRAMKTYLLIHQDPVIKNSYLHELEEILYEVNAECQYMLLRLQDDIDRFCLAFSEQELKPNDEVINDIVSGAIVPLVVSEKVSLEPYFVGVRPTEQELMQKYFITSEVSAPQLPLHAYTTTVVKESRLNLQAALARTRTPQVDKAERPKEEFMQSVGLITLIEKQRINLSQEVKQTVPQQYSLPPKKQKAPQPK